MSMNDKDMIGYITICTKCGKEYDTRLVCPFTGEKNTSGKAKAHENPYINSCSDCYDVFNTWRKNLCKELIR